MIQNQQKNKTHLTPQQIKNKVKEHNGLIKICNEINTSCECEDLTTTEDVYYQTRKLMKEHLPSDTSLTEDMVIKIVMEQLTTHITVIE